MKEKIRMYALQNAVKFNGKASPGAVIGKLISEDPKLKENMKEISQEVNKVIEDISLLTREAQIEELNAFGPIEQPKKKPQKKELPELKKNVIMRFEPSPSGALHIGHAYVLSLNSELCRKNKGKLILRIGDTNPENIYPPAYDMIKKDAKWITKNNISKVIIQSERLEKYYEAMEKLINKEKAYICTCDPEKYKKLIKKCAPCPCRDLSKEKNKERWKKMFKGYKQGDAVARCKTDISHKNPAMRDFPIFRINDAEHPKTKNKYRVWPLMNIAVAVDDAELKISHAVRAKDHADNAKRQEILHDYLHEKTPETLFVGRINFEGMPVSASKTRKAIEEGKYSGWDDIRLPFLPALKRRGYQPEAFIKYALDVGISLTDKKVTKEEFFKTVNAFNKDIIDSTSLRYFFINNPKEITIKQAPKQNIELDLHPDNKKGGRKFKTHNKFYITKEDYKRFKKGELYRLMDCLNFKDLKFDSKEYDKYKEEGKMIIHWLPKTKDLINVEVLMEDNKIVKGFGEHSMKNIKQGDIVQLERFGFCRLDKIEKDKLIFWFGHR